MRQRLINPHKLSIALIIFTPTTIVIYKEGIFFGNKTNKYEEFDLISKLLNTRLKKKLFLQVELRTQLTWLHLAI